jgi:hypothetical protein
MTFVHLLFFSLDPSGKNINTDNKLYNTLPSITREKSPEIQFFVFKIPIEFIQQAFVGMVLYCFFIPKKISTKYQGI